MQIDVLIEPVAGNGFLAKTGEPLALSADGATEDEALARLRREIHARLTGGRRLVALEVANPHPFAPFAGIFPPDDAMVQEWIEIMAENRRKADAEPDLP
jgi:hypothetical protein